MASLNDKTDNPEIEKIADFLGKVKFKKTLFGGVNEQDVWKKINDLNEMYANALAYERARYNTLLDEYKK